MTDAHEHGDSRGDSRLEAEGEVALARLALDGGDLAHAAGHLGNAITLDPRLPEVHEALAELAARAGGAQSALGYFTPAEPVIGDLACRAHLSAACGQWGQALRLLAGVLRHEPHRPWAAVAWLARVDLPQLIDPDDVMRAIATVVGGGLAEPLPAGPAESLRPFYQAVQHSAAAHPDHAGLLVMASGLARRYGEHARAIAWARHAQHSAPSHSGAVMLGYALRADGRPEEALAVWQQELRRDPTDLSLHTDVGELYARIGRPAEGLAWIEQALAVDPLHPQAAPALHGVRYALDGSGTHLAALVDHLREHPEHRYAATVLARCSAGLPWLGQVGQATEASVAMLRHVLEQQGTVRKTTISALEPASALRTLHEALPGLQLTVLAAHEPDLRKPLREVGVRLWRYEGMDAYPAIEPPSAKAAALMQSVADLSWPHLLAAYDHAVALSGLSLDDLLGLLAHPPAPGDDEAGRRLAARWPDIWVRAVQTFACLGLTHHRADQSWAGSDRRRVLLDLLFGVEDWVTETAAVALVTVAWTDPTARRDASEQLAHRLLEAVTASRTRAVTVLPSLCRLALAMPALEPSAAALAREVLAGLEPAADPDPEEPAPEVAAAKKRRWFGRR
ncbi:tetratricopeptide (TPR) repeat protein [Kitasatospora sp. MAP12-15]|uniref:hypothetical protein n=1 Tax=unclassified Kitasatospora TaxID=2633591 RepID=UPI0024746842|nr:hypothetical protein [Kitasatospora sp. MAP12-44]MDH6114265.1 tetratricopeptide (TPR) repeat protein [Kitasatospora sp. MAP12-44]